MFGHTRGQRTLGPEDDYIKRLAVYQIRNGLNNLDLTREQTERLRAYERSADVHVAKHLIFGRRRYRSGSMTDG